MSSFKAILPFPILPNASFTAPLGVAAIQGYSGGGAGVATNATGDSFQPVTVGGTPHPPCTNVGPFRELSERVARMTGGRVKRPQTVTGRVIGISIEGVADEVAISYRGKEYFIGPPQEDTLVHLNSIYAEDGWIYVGHTDDDDVVDDAIRVRKVGKNKYRVEPWPRGTHRFPQERPVMVRDAKGEVWNVITTGKDGRHILAVETKTPPTGSIGRRYRMFRDDGNHLRRIGLERSSDALLRLVGYDRPLEVWERLSRRKEVSSEGYNMVRIDVTVFDEPTATPSEKPFYREYIVRCAGYPVAVRLPDFRNGEVAEIFDEKSKHGFHIKQFHEILSVMPIAMLTRLRMITVVSENQRFEAGEYFKGGHVLVAYPIVKIHSWRSLLFHEIGHAWTHYIPINYLMRLMAAVEIAVQKDGRAGYRKGAKEHWQQALAIGFENFEKAGLHMQQLILSLILNPAWEIPQRGLAPS